MLRRARLCMAAVLLCTALGLGARAQDAPSTKGPLKVYILAGQSNMEGHAKPRTFKHIGMDPKTAPMLEKMLGPDGEPRVLEDVRIACIRGTELDEEQFGTLRVGYGGKKLAPKIGPEYTFGITMHEALQEPILLIKTAWGGKSLNYHFRPPSADEWTPPEGHPDLTVVEEDKPEPLPVPNSLDLPVGYKPGRQYLNPYAGHLGFNLVNGMRGCSIGEHNGVHPIYVCQTIKARADEFPLRKGDIILGINGEGMRKNPKDHWRKVLWGDVMNRPDDWTLTVSRWRDGKIDTVDIDIAEFRLEGGKADIPKVMEKRRLAAIEREKNAGMYYRLMIDYTKHVLNDIKRVYPGYDPQQGYEIAGFVWFQGWNDMVDGGVYPNRDKPRGYEQYSWLLRHFIRDVRKDLKAPAMPFVIGVMGIGGDDGKPDYFREAMAAPAADPEFKDTVTAVHTAQYWDKQLEELRNRDYQVKLKRREFTAKGLEGDDLAKAMAEYERSVWTPEEKAIYAAGVSNKGFHYLGSAKILGQIGKAFAEAMLELKEERQAE